MFLLVEDLLHFAVLQIVQLTHRILGPLNEVNENAWRTFSTHKIMLNRERRKWSESNIERNKTEFLVFH